MSNTLNNLAKHHGNSEDFVNLMQNTADNRFNQEFWQLWQHWLGKNLTPDAVIADFGCGPAVLLGELRQHYPQAHLIGIECMPYMLAAINKNNYEIIEYDLNQPQLPLETASLDGLICAYVLHEMAHPMHILRAFYRTLKPNARGIIVDWARTPLANYVQTQQVELNSEDTSALIDIFAHFSEHNRYTMEDVTWLLAQVGLKVIHVQRAQNHNFAYWIIER